MVSTGALNDISAAFGANTATYGQKANTQGSGGNFADAIRGTASEKTEALSAAGNAAVSFSAGADVQRLGMMKQMKQVDFSADLFFNTDEDSIEDDLDSSISFDEIEELDRMGDIGFELQAANEPPIFPD